MDNYLYRMAPIKSNSPDDKTPFIDRAAGPEVGNEIRNFIGKAQKEFEYTKSGSYAIEKPVTDSTADGERDKYLNGRVENFKASAETSLKRIPSLSPCHAQAAE